MLLAAAKRMDVDALTEIFELYAPVLYKYAFRQCKNAMMADQLVADVFERFIQQVSSGRIPGVNLRTCLYEIAYSLLVRDARYKDYFLTADGTFLRHPERSTVELGTNDQRLFSAIQRTLFYDLTDDQRHVLLLRFVEGFSLKETAAITGKKVNNVKVIQNRAITALRKAVGHPVTESQTITLFLRRLAQI